MYPRTDSEASHNDLQGEHSKQSLRSAETISPRGATDSASALPLPFVTLPTQFGRFRVERLLGHGAMGAVYLAWDTQLDRAVALKVPRLTGAEDSDVVPRLLREAKSAARLDHPNICRVYDVGNEAGTAFIAMQFVEGRPLSDYIAPGHLQNERLCVELVRKLASALVEAHAKGIIHRDLKPANILINERGEPILMDFGLARRADSARDGRATQAGMLIGSPAYMSPEQANGEIDKIGPWSDLYSLGVLLFELLTNQLPFQGSVLTILSQIATKEPPLPSSLRPGLDPRLDLICRRMMAKRPQDRFASMIEVEQVLTTWLSGTADNDTPTNQTNEASRRASAPGLLKSEISNLKSEISKSPGADALRLASPPSAPSTISVSKKSIAPPNDIAQQQERAKQFLAKRDYEAAIPLLTKLAALKEPQFQETATWAKQTLPTAHEQQQKLREAAVSACQKARALRLECDYAGAVQVLELIPVAGRTTELQQLLAESTDLADECSSLRQEIDESLKRKKYSRLRSLLERYLKLKPDSPKLERLLRNLEKNHPARAVANFQETQTYYDVAGRLFTPRDIFLIVVVFATVFLAVSYTFISYLAKRGNGEPQVAVSDDASAERLNPPPIISPPAVAPDSPMVLPVPKSAKLTIQQLPAVSLKAGESQRIMVRVERENTNGDVRLEFQGLPSTVTVKGGVATVPFASNQVEVELVADSNANDANADVRVIAALASVSHTQSFRLNVIKQLQAPPPTLPVPKSTAGQETLTLKGQTSPVWSVTFSADGKISPVWSVAFSADGKRLAAASHYGTIKVWDTTSGQEMLILKGHASTVRSVVFSADGKRLASASDDRTVKVWDATSGQATLTITKGHITGARSVAFSPDGKRLVSANFNGMMKIWDVASGQATLTLKGHPRDVRSVVFSTDGKRLASASEDGTVKVWDATSGQETLTLIGHTGGVTSVAFSADGKRLASASQWVVKGNGQSEVKVWDATTGKATLTLKAASGVALSADGKRLASASGGTMKLWDAASGQETLSLNGNTGAVLSVAFSLDGKRLASANYNGEVKVWDVTPR